MELQNIEIAEFALKKKYSDLSAEIIDQLKRHLLDSIGSLINATTSISINKLVQQLKILGENGPCKVPLLDGLAADRAAQLYTALIRYPDFMDNYMGKEATCHPSDNIGSLLSVCQLKNSSGSDFLTAMAIAYQIECRLVEEIPVMKEGIDHTLLLAYSIVASVSKILGLSQMQTAHALAIAGTSISPMVTSRASYSYEWKGFASSIDALGCVNVVFQAQQDMTGPLALFEGPKGFDEVFGMKLDYNWREENFELVPKCVLKRYNAEVHSQATLEAVTELKKTHQMDPAQIERVDVTTFLTAYHIIGSGAYGDRKKVASKEQADHSLFYLVAVALIDGDVWPEQFSTERILRSDVQDLLQKVFVDTKSPLHKPVMIAGFLDPYTQAYPDKMKTKVEIKMKDGRTLTCEKEDYHGFFTRPFTWNDTIGKFKRLCGGIIGEEQQEEIIGVVRGFEDLPVGKLIDLICVRS